HRCGIDSLLVLALTLAVKLLPPLGYVVQARLIIGQDFHGLSLAVQNIADSRILHGVIFRKGAVQRQLSAGSCASHQLIYVSSAGCDGQQTNSSQYGETSTNIVRYDECLIS